ncbi:hypothetical protein OG21DRAFT_1513554 [Imleria badia]|nr:hypothetical protein OG21DRAFT_1513554 [Imleria badia]
MPSAANQPHVQPWPGPSQWRSATDVQMTGATPAEFAPREKKTSLQRPSSPTHSNQVTGKAARKFGSAVSTTSAEEDDVEMQVDSPNFSESTSRAMSRASGPPSSIRSESIAEPPPHARATSSTNEREVRPVNQVVAEDDDDSDDLYGPPVQRQIIRILPSLAEELREQQRRVAAEKEKRRAPLAPDWILAKHVNDPLWKEIPTQGRKRRKPTARKLGDNGLNVNVNELMGCFTVQNWVREHKT